MNHLSGKTTITSATSGGRLSRRRQRSATSSGGMSPGLEKLWFPVDTSAPQRYKVFFNGHKYNIPPPMPLAGEDDAPRKTHFCSRCKSPSSSDRGPSGPLQRYAANRIASLRDPPRSASNELPLVIGKSISLNQDGFDSPEQ